MPSSERLASLANSTRWSAFTASTPSNMLLKTVSKRCEFSRSSVTCRVNARRMWSTARANVPTSSVAADRDPLLVIARRPRLRRRPSAGTGAA